MAEILPQQVIATGMWTPKSPSPPSASSAVIPSTTDPTDPPPPPKKFPKGVVLGKDGKPCRSCTSFASWAALTQKQTRTPSTTITTTNNITSSSSITSDCPPDVNQLGKHSWTLLHSLSANYPERASIDQQKDMQHFLTLFSTLYPCWTCAEDFQTWMKSNRPRLEGRDGFGRWMCEAHNEVNRKLGKNPFDCTRWEERWRVGWRDGRCD